jgi:hypothetical protein
VPLLEKQHVGEIKNNRFVVSSFKLLPEEKETEQK